jgi:hypothetical protein
MIDYFGNEIHIGDTILYASESTKGYRASFDESIVEEVKENRNEVMVKNYVGWQNSRGRKCDNVINLTALGLR